MSLLRHQHLYVHSLTNTNLAQKLQESQPKNTHTKQQKHQPIIRESPPQQKEPVKQQVHFNTQQEIPKPMIPKPQEASQLPQETLKTVPTKQSDHKEPITVPVQAQHASQQFVKRANSPQKQNTPTKTSITAAVAAVSVPQAKIKIPTTAPKTSFEFEKNFKELQGQDLYKYLAIISPSSYKTLFKDSLTTELFNGFVDSILNFFLK